MASNVSVNTKYSKYEQARASLDHAFHLRNGFTCSHNVIEHLTKDNVGYYYHGAKNGVDGLDLMYKKYKEVTGRSCRSDFNCLFEHVVVFSEEQYSFLEKKYGKEKLKQAMMHQLKEYAKRIQSEFGFQPISVDLHFDEGQILDYNANSVQGHGESISNMPNVKRNIHAHVSFFNYNFEKKIAPLRHLMKKGKSENGRTNSINLNFSKMQDIAADVFGHEKLGFKRGISKDITGVEHKSKVEFVQQKLADMEQEVSRLSKLKNELERAIKSKSHKLISKVSRKLTALNLRRNNSL
jgi:hypothetical protein